MFTSPSAHKSSNGQNPPLSESKSCAQSGATVSGNFRDNVAIGPHSPSEAKRCNTKGNSSSTRSEGSDRIAGANRSVFLKTPETRDTHVSDVLPHSLQSTIDGWANAAKVFSPLRTQAKMVDLSARSPEQHGASNEHVALIGFACRGCDRHFRSKSTYRTHASFCESRGLWPCVACPKVYHSLKAWRLHVRMVHAGSEVECFRCSKMFTTPAALRRHKNRSKCGRTRRIWGSAWK